MITVSSATQGYKTLSNLVLDWRHVLQRDDGAGDTLVLRALTQVAGQGRFVLVGRRELAAYVAPYLDVAEVDQVAADYLLEVPQAYRERVAALGQQSVGKVFLICEVDRVNAATFRAALGSDAACLDFDVFGLLARDHLPDAAWTPAYDHIYPVAIPEISFASGLDALILDMPARSIAQLPVGFAYVYKALKQTSIKLQACDLDIVCYHRYHQRRCLNQWAQVEDANGNHPPDPWQADNYLLWTCRTSQAYFTDLITEIADKIVAAAPKIIGFSLHQTSHLFIRSVVDLVRPRLPDAVVVVGGMSCYQHAVARNVFPQADYTVVGECDTVVGPLFEALARGERPRDLPGILSRHDTPGRRFIGAPLAHNLDVLGAPDYSFSDLSLYHNWNRYQLVPVVGSRGCGWSRCTFCAERFNWRARTPELVAEEIEGYTRQGFRYFVFNESDFNSDHGFVIRLCEDIIRREMDIYLTAQLRISRKSDHAYFKLMKDAGFRCLRFGIDGLSENTLRLQRKGYTLDDVRNNLRACADVGLFAEVNVVLGVPGETEEDINETINFLIEMKPYLGRVAFINPLMLFVGSVYYNDPEQFKIKFRVSPEELGQHFVSLPDDIWYSEDPYIDHEIRHARLFRVVESLFDAGVPLGTFAKFTVEQRRRQGEDSHSTASKNLAELSDAR